MKETEIKKLANEIKKEIEDISEIFLFGSFITLENKANDIDLALIINQRSNLLNVIKRANKIILPYILKENILISSFPILKKAFTEERSQFIKNVKSSGKRL